MQSVVTAPATAFALSFGDRAAAAGAPLHLALPLLGGAASERLFPMAAPAGQAGRFALFKAEAWLIGCASAPIQGDLEPQARALYAELFAAARPHHLCRIWNYVPGINATGPDGIENYQAFSRARSLAFESEFGPSFNLHLPAASAVGVPESRLTVMFAASTVRPTHRESPRQMPAYEYPPEHGPRPPSFARATLVAARDGGVTAFIAGTSAIRGHATIAPGDTPLQLDCTLENLRAISEVCGLGADFAAGRAQARFFRVYLRHAADYAGVARRLNETLLRRGDCVTFLQADLCRAGLNVEIEATILDARPIR